MRLLLIITGLILLFVLLVWITPPALHIPLYCLFTTAGVGYAWWERRRLAGRRVELEEELARQRLDQPGRCEEE